MAESLRVAPRRALSQKIGEHPTTLSRLHGSKFEIATIRLIGRREALFERERRAEPVAGGHTCALATSAAD
jgi:hypothetical protein